MSSTNPQNVGARESDRLTASADSSPVVMPISNKRRYVLMSSLALSYFCLFMTYAGLVVILLPQQMAILDAAHKVTNLAMVTSISAVATIFVQPIVGALSDRTRTSLGRRAPWILIGGIGGGICTIAIQFAQSLFWIAFAWVVIQVLLNAAQGPFSAIISDRIESEQRGTASAFTGVGMSLGATVGTILAGQFLNNIGIGYTVFGVIVIVICILFVIVNPGKPNKTEAVEKMHWGAFFRSFLVNPRKHPDFCWAFGGRFFMILGTQCVSNYQLYILTDYIKVDSAQTAGIVSVLSIITLITTTISTLIAGRMSDKIGRRKVFVFLATLCIAAAVCIPLAWPTVAGMYIYAALGGLANGAYASVDMAMMVDVLPSSTDAGKDLGILNVASNVPQALTPVIAAALLSVFAYNYQVLFFYAAAAVVLSSLFVLPIKSVK